MTYKIKKSKVYSRVDTKNWYAARGSNSLTEIRKRKIWAEKNYPQQRFVIVDNLKASPKKYKDYRKMRYKSGLDNRYYLYGYNF